MTATLGAPLTVTIDDVKRIDYLTREMRKAVRDSEDSLARWRKHTDPKLYSDSDRYQRQRDVVGKGILSDGEWAHRRAQTYAATLKAEIERIKFREVYGL